jgi:hypothetical protein
VTVCLPTACAGLVLAGDITSCPVNMQRTLASDGSWLLEPVQICQADSEARYRRGLQIKHNSAGIPPRQIADSCAKLGCILLASRSWACRYSVCDTVTLAPKSYKCDSPLVTACLVIHQYLTMSRSSIVSAGLMVRGHACCVGGSGHMTGSIPFLLGVWPKGCTHMRPAAVLSAGVSRSICSSAADACLSCT